MGQFVWLPVHLNHPPRSTCTEYIDIQAFTNMALCIKWLGISRSLERLGQVVKRRTWRVLICIRAVMIRKKPQAHSLNTHFSLPQCTTIP